MLTWLPALKLVMSLKLRKHIYADEAKLQM